MTRLVAMLGRRVKELEAVGIATRCLLYPGSVE
jgi:hypothetical protein